MGKIRLTAVSYLNTKPLLYGILQHRIAASIDLKLDIPSVCAERLKNGSADLGLIPVAAIPELSRPYIVTDYCIGTVGPVKSVCLYGDVPVEEMTHIYLDYQSRTSVELVKILLNEYWNVSPTLIPAEAGFEKNIQGKHGGLIIGDRTIGKEQQHNYLYDLGQAWFEHMQLPFVFAAWVSNKPLPDSFIREFNEALKSGVEQIPQLIYLLPSPAEDFDLQEYYTRFISYELDRDKKKALSVFLQKISDRRQPTVEKSLALVQS